MLIAVVVILLVIASVAFHFWSPWWLTDIASNWTKMDDTLILTFWVTGIVFVVLNLFLAWVIIRYRHKPGQKADYEPENQKLEWWLTGVTSVGVIAMLAPGLSVWGQFVTVPENASTVEAVGQQWHWTYRFPGADNKLGRTDPRLMTVDNPFGMDPNDPNGQDDKLVYNPELHLPLGQPVKMLLRSKDVLHNFTVAQFRVKMDLVPGMVTYQWLTPTAVGEYDLLCMELCGVAHFAMRGRVIVDPPGDFETWIAAQPTFAETQAAAVADAASGAAMYAVCTACHGASGEGNPAMNAPKLAGQEAWYIRRQVQNFQRGLRGSNAEDTYGVQMTAFASMLADDATLRNVAAYIEALPDTDAGQTVVGDAARGKSLYTTCANCHGASGEGIWSQNAPRLAGMSDWYLSRQIHNFRTGVRGGHRQDFNGRQMTALTSFLYNDKAIADVVSYINTLEPPTPTSTAGALATRRDF